MNIWFNVPPHETAVIKRVVSLLHGASLMLDDIQDSSELRRGKPAAHMVFGTMQTINSAGYRFLDALSEVRKLGSERCMDVFCGEQDFLPLTYARQWALIARSGTPRPVHRTKP